MSPEDGPYGFFPMRLGQKLCDGKYKVVRKLGYGAYSSVWLARETMCVLLHSSYPGAHYRSAFSRPDGHRYVAIKVLSVFSTNIEYRKLYYEFAVAESMSTFQRSDLAHPGYQHCAIIKRTFMEDSAHGEHLCVVLTPYGTSLRDILETSPTCRLPLSAAKRVTRQVLLGLSFLESKLQRVHTGQLSLVHARPAHSHASQMSSWRMSSSNWIPVPNKSTAFF